MKMRTGQPDKDIGIAFGICKMTVGRRLKDTRKAFVADFMNTHVNVLMNRDVLLQHSTEMSRVLFSQGENDTVALVWDGTYIYINKSRNYQFQKDT